MKTDKRIILNVLLVAALALSLAPFARPAQADNTAQSLPFSQGWSNTGLITTEDNWSGVPGISGFRGDNLTAVNDVDPQTVLADETTVDVIANQTNPNTLTTGGVAEFHIADPVVALQGSGTADAPFLLLHLNTTGLSSITISYNLRDIDGSTDNAVQQVALQFRVGSSGNFTNVPAGYVADATTGPSLATLVTPVSVVLPAAADNQPLVQVRMITTNAAGSDEWVGIDDISVTGSTADAAPTVSSTTPANGAVDVAVDANITINFSEAVDVTGNWFDIACAGSGSHTATVSGGLQNFTLDPDADFADGELCTVTVFAANVTDQDTDDPPDNMAANHVFSFTTADVQLCGDPATLIHTIQGSGLTSPLNGTPNTVIEGVVVGDYQAAGQFGGFYVQEEDADADADPATSEGLFVFNTSFGVNVGDKVRVKGTVTEFSNLTELASVSVVLVCSTDNSITPATVNLPVSSLNDWEAFEGMLIDIPQNLTVTENFTLGRFGEVSLSVGGRLLNPTMVTTPGAAANALQNLNDRSRIILDDANNQQNIDPTRYPAGGLSALNTLRSGDTVNGLSGVLDQRFGAYRVQPVGSISFNATNPRPAAPDPVDGTLKVSAMNVLNYFTTLDAPGSGPFICGPLAILECRGANSPAEFTRQRDKIISAIIGLDADVIGLMELENNATAAIQDLVNGLNDEAGAGTYAFINTGTIGTDAIKVGLIYRPAAVTPVGAHAILDSSFDPQFIDTLNRPVLAQTFEQNVNGQRFTVAVNHLKSKGSNCNAVGDPDTGDGQGNCNVTRTDAAAVLVNWLATDPTGSGDPDFLIIGDLNSYAMEGPITAIKNAGYTNLIDAFLSLDAYSFVFQGQSGYLDHALSNPSLTPQVTGATEWHVNADEPIALDYNLEFKTPNHQSTLYDPGTYRSSDHDPLIVGLCQPPSLGVSVSPDTLWPANHAYVTVNATVDGSADTSAITLLSVTSNEPDNGDDDGNTVNDIVIVDDFTFNLRAERSGVGTGRVYTITYQATNTCGNSTIATATVTVPLSQGGG